MADFAYLYLRIINHNLINNIQGDFVSINFFSARLIPNNEIMIMWKITLKNVSLS